MDNDDKPIGKILNRRKVLAALGLGSLGLMGQEPANAQATNALPSCIVRPAMTEGPYFVDEKLNRSDIRSDPSNGQVKAGIPLKLSFLVSRVASSGCTPLAGAQIDLWHCDAMGVYSDVVDRGFSTVGQKFLRGHQVSDKTGSAHFTTIYPGWYQGRAVHIHFKIRYQGKEFTSQLFFDDALSDQVYTAQPYASKPGVRSPRNSGDGIYRNGGSQLLLKAVGDNTKGYSATFDIGLNI